MAPHKNNNNTTVGRKTTGMINLFMPSGRSYFNLWNGPFQMEEMSGYFLFLPYFIEIPAVNANSVDPDQTPRSAASDLGH